MSIKLLSLFSGIGAFEKALLNLGIDYDLTAFCECNVYAIKSYTAIFGGEGKILRNLGDITQVDPETLSVDIDLITYGFPCTDVSRAGKQKGLISDGNKTRSGLVYDALKIIKHIKPRYAIAENVKGMVGKKFRSQFDEILKELDEAGYNNYWKILNATDFGIPQNRERVFLVSIRKDSDLGDFSFPEGKPLQYCLRDFLEPEVSEKHYLRENTIKHLENHRARNKSKGNGFGWDPCNGQGVARTLSSAFKYRASDNYILEQVAQIYPGSGNPQAGRIFSPEGLCPVISASDGGNTQPKIIENTPAVRIRKLTPKECWRLMGFSDEDFKKAEKVNSDTQLYMQAGNSIVVPVLEAIFAKLFRK